MSIDDPTIIPWVCTGRLRRYLKTDVLAYLARNRPAGTGDVPDSALADLPAVATSEEVEKTLRLAKGSLARQRCEAMRRANA